MKLQFFHIHDLCKCIDSIVRLHPEDHVFNVGDDQIVSIREWVDACYRVAGKEAHYVSVPESVNPREYLAFLQLSIYTGCKEAERTAGCADSIDRRTKEFL